MDCDTGTGTYHHDTILYKCLDYQANKNWKKNYINKKVTSERNVTFLFMLFQIWLRSVYETAEQIALRI